MSKVRALAAWPCGRRSKYVVLGVWLLLAVIAFPLAGKLTDAQNNELSSWLPSSAESTKAVREQEDFQENHTVPAVVLYERASGLTDADRAAIADDILAFDRLPGVDQRVPPPLWEPGGRAAEVIVQVTVEDGGWQDINRVVEDMRDRAEQHPEGLRTYVTGPAGLAADQSKAFEGIDGRLLYSAITVVVILLLLTYRSPVLWLFPVISAVVALFSAQAVVYLFTKAGLVVNGQSQGILTVLIFGAGTDYALLLVARYREELRRYEDRHEAMAHALLRAAPAIIASAATVGVGMLCLLAAEMESTKGLGPVCALGVLVALLVMLTLLPALLVTVGRWVFWPVRPVAGTADRTGEGMWGQVGRGIARRPRVVWIVTAGVLAVLALGLTRLDASGIANKDSFTDRPESISGAAAAARYFPAGSGDPVLIYGNAATAGQLRAAVAQVPGVIPEQVVETGLRAGRVQIEATLAASTDSEEARRTVERIRDATHAVPGADAVVGGGAAIALDVLDAAHRDDIVIIPLILLVVLVILGLLLRAIVAPLVLIATVVLSFAAALGISAVVFEHVLGFEGADPGFPLFVFVFLVALGIDYNVFLMSRVHEEAGRHGTRRGMLIGLAVTGGVITSAGLVLASTFAVLGTLPLVAFAEIGFTVALGVLLDTFVVRSILVTALTLDIGRPIWWPSALARRPEPDDDVPPPGGQESELVG